MHEHENNGHELHDGHDGEQGDNEPFLQREVNDQKLHAGDDRENHRQLNEDVEFTLVGVRVVGRKGGGCSSAHWRTTYSRR